MNDEASMNEEKREHYAVEVRDDHDGGSVWYEERGELETAEEAERAAVEISLARRDFNGLARVVRVTRAPVVGVKDGQAVPGVYDPSPRSERLEPVLDKMLELQDRIETSQRVEEGRGGALGALARARERCSVADAYTLRAIAHNWRGVDEVTMLGPRLVAEQILGALDALAIVHGNEAEAAEVDGALRAALGEDEVV